MHKDVDEILEEVIKERRNSGQRIVWEEGFREGYKIGYGQVMRKMAIGLAEEGYTVEKIAMGMEEDVETVKKWLQQKDDIK
ncbi:hypothetical protein DW058_12015 [Clostridiaceae bacterium AF42-6]|nr:hypothetical protein DW058_12015 [Clostridiaceae bacterium AF42-6]RHP49831.1 hypothetical protein DWZ37_10605 [Clostridiaceae bacterium AF31-3BH]RHQ24353.1 hypothetical protein DWZ08_10235 [Clostridiaceae bacterium AF29-16BH]